MNRFLAVLLLMIPVLLFAQPAPDTLWTRTYGGAGNDVPTAIRQTRDGGYIIAGYTTSFGAGGADAYLIKLDSLGTLQWQQAYGDPDWERANDIRQTPDDGYIVVVNSFVSGASDPAVFRLLRVDSNGDSLWEQTYDFSQHQDAFHVAVLTEGFLVTCMFDTVDLVGWWETRCLLAVDSAGDVLWTHTWPGHVGPWTDAYSWGDMDCSASGQIIISGSWYAANYYPPPQWAQYNWQLYAYGMNGDSLWAVSGVEQAGRIYGGAVCAMSDGGCLLEVKYYGIMHVDSLRNVTLLSEHTGFADIRPLSQQQGYVLLTTVTGAGNDICLSAWGFGDPLFWQGTWGGAGDDRAVALESTSDSGYVIVGTTTSFGAGGTDIYVIKTDPHHFLSTEERRTTLPSSFTLSAYPNPFNPSTTLSFSLPKAGKAKLTVYNVEGRLVRVLADVVMQAGEHHIAFDGATLPSGIYFVRVTAGDLAATKKIMLLK